MDNKNKGRFVNGKMFMKVDEVRCIGGFRILCAQADQKVEQGTGKDGMPNHTRSC